MNAPIGDPAWLSIARKYVGLAEIHGPHHNPHILQFWHDIGSPIHDDETPWCGAFVGGVLSETGIKPVAGAAAARNWLGFGVRLGKPAYGAIVVFWRGSPTSGNGHVGFVVGRDQRGNVMVLGGNQGNRVSIKPFNTYRVLGYRWPGIYPYPSRFDLPLFDTDGRVSTNEA